MLPSRQPAAVAGSTPSAPLRFVQQLGALAESSVAGSVQCSAGRLLLWQAWSRREDGTWGELAPPGAEATATADCGPTGTPLLLPGQPGAEKGQAYAQMYALMAHFTAHEQLGVFVASPACKALWGPPLPGSMSLPLQAVGETAVWVEPAESTRSSTTSAQ